MPRLAVEHLSWGAGEYDTVKAARFSALVFGARGIVPFAYAAFAFTLGVVAGLLLRRPVAAMAVTLAIYAVMQFAVPTLLRPHYMASRTAVIPLDSTTLSHADGIILNGSSLKIGGITMPDAWVLSTGHAVDAAGRDPDADKLENCLSPGKHAQTIDCLAAQNLHVGAAYQPNGRYWPFQFIEAGIYLAAAVIFSVLCFRQIERTA